VAGGSALALAGAGATLVTLRLATVAGLGALVRREARIPPMFLESDRGKGGRCCGEVHAILDSYWKIRMYLIGLSSSVDIAAFLYAVPDH
jgi:hypothetical protein